MFCHSCETRKHIVVNLHQDEYKFPVYAQALQNERKQHLQLGRDHRVNQGNPRQPGTRDLDKMQRDYHGTRAAGCLGRAVSTTDKCSRNSNLGKYHSVEKKAPERDDSGI